MNHHSMMHRAGLRLAAAASLALVVQAGVAAAQPANQPPPGGDPGYGQTPPAYGYQQGPGGPPPAYDARAREADEAYAARYSDWAARYCVDRHNNNVAAGAIIGGVLGAVVGGGLAGRYDRGAGVVVGGGLGAVAGAAVGANSNPGAGCPPGYVIRSGAPAFVYAGPAYPAVDWAPPGYRPWVWYGGRWVYRPYRYWYYRHWGPRPYW